jgi:hypothetical protein
VNHGVDQSQMGEGLREIAQLAAAARIELFGVEAEGAGE